MNGLWYFAHPYTVKNEKGDYVFEGEEANFRLCNYRAALLIEKGILLYSPISHTHPIHSASPVFAGGQAHGLWYDFDNAFIRIVPFTGIILAPGWQDSKGCKGEKALFEDLGREVRYLHENGEIASEP